MPLSSEFGREHLWGGKLTNCRNRHYLNDRGDCVACSEFKGPWPDDGHEGGLEDEPAELYAGAVIVDRPSA